MGSITLAEAAVLAQDMLVAGVIEDIITVNRMFEVLPFEGISGNALSLNREDTLGDAQETAVNDTITAKNPATFDNSTFSLTTILGDAEVNGLVEATQSDTTDQTSAQISSKSKNVGRRYQNMLINGDGSGNTFTGLINLCDATQTINNLGAALSYEILDNLLDLVTDKDGEVDYFAMPAKLITLYKTLGRNLGGTNINDMYELPSGRKVPQYSGVPIFRNDWIPTNVTNNSVANTGYVFAGTFDDGSHTHGIAGLTASKAAGIHVEDVGAAELKDNHIYRVKWYAGLAMFSKRGLAMAKGIKTVSL